MAEPLKIAAVTHDEQQTVMEFASNADDAKLLAIPAEDVARWRPRVEFGRNRALLIDHDWLMNPHNKRYLDFKQFCRSYSLPVQAVLMGVSATAFELVRNDSAVGLATIVRARFHEVVIESWRWDEADAALLKKSIDIGVKSGILVMVDPADPAIESIYVPARARGRPRAGACGRNMRNVRPNAGATYTSSSLSKSLPTTSTNGEPAPGIVIRPGVYAYHSDPVGAFELLSKAIADTRRNKGRAVYPATAADFRDLKHAVKSACEIGKLDELVTALRAATDWANNGAGFSHAMKDAGFL